MHTTSSVWNSDILVVEGDADLSELLVATLRTAGHVTQNVATGDDAWERLFGDARVPKLIIADADSWELLGDIRAHARLARIAVLVLARRDAANDPLVTFLSRALDKGTFLSTVERCLAGAPPSQRLVA